MRWLFTLAGAASFGLLAACDAQRVVGGPGNGTETENVLAARVLTANGTPAAKSVARLRPLWWGASPDSSDPEGGAFRTVVADSAGYVVIRGVPQGLYGLEIRDALSRTVMFPVGVGPGNVNLGSGTLVTRAKLTGTIPLPPGQKRAWVRVRGVSAGCWTDSNGAYSLSVPASLLLPEVVLPKQASAMSTPVQTTAGKTVNWTASVGRKEILLEDFEDADDTRTPWGKLLGGGGRWWGAGSGPDLIPAIKFPILTPGIVKDSNKSLNRVLKLSTRLANDSNVIFGFELDGNGNGFSFTRSSHDLSILDSIVVWAKGSGNFGVKITGAWEDSGFFYVANVKLDTVWKRYAIPADSLIPGAMARQSGISWRERAKKAQGVGFQMRGNCTVSLDKITLVGLESKDIWPYLLTKP